MILPPAPFKYDFRDQNEIRRILEQGLEDTIRRLLALESGVSDPVTPPGDSALLVGLFGMHDRVGQGPGSDTDSPIYNWAYLNPHASSDFDAQLDLAEAHDIKLMVVPSGSPGAYGASSATGFDMTAYRGLLDDIKVNPKFQDAVDAGRVHFYIGDEPNHTKWNNSGGANTLSCATFNQCAREHKIRWPGCLTYARVTPKILQSGWDGHTPVTYDALDYGWVQYSSAAMRAGMTPLQHIEAERAAAAAINVGIAHSMNLWAAGNRNDMDGVAACWDNEMDGSSSGVIVGTPASAGFSEGTKITCAQKVTAGNQLLAVAASPDWLRRWIDTVYDDPDLPFAAIWTYPSSGQGVGWGIPLVDRADYVSALEYCVQKGLTRPAWNGYRTPKV